MESFIIEGGHQLQGTITPQGAKNEALEVIAAVLLTSDLVRITNIPDILDVNNLIRLLQDMGVKVTRNGRIRTQVLGASRQCAYDGPAARTLW